MEGSDDGWSDGIPELVGIMDVVGDWLGTGDGASEGIWLVVGGLDGCGDSEGEYDGCSDGTVLGGSEGKSDGSILVVGAMLVDGAPVVGSELGVLLGIGNVGL